MGDQTSHGTGTVPVPSIPQDRTEEKGSDGIEESFTRVADASRQDELKQDTEKSSYVPESSTVNQGEVKEERTEEVKDAGNEKVAESIDANHFEKKEDESTGKEVGINDNLKMEEEKVEKPKMDEEKVEASLIGEEKVETLKVEEEKAEKMDEEKVEPTKMEEESTEKEGDKVDTPKNDDKVVELENKPSDTKMEEESKSKTEELAAASNNDSKEDATLNGGDTEASPSRRMYKNLDDYLVSPGESSNITKGKRTRRTVERHDPSLYARSTPEKSSPLFMDGRGTKLNDIESVQNSIQSRNDQLLRTAYKFLFTARGKQVKLSLNQIKQSLLNYSGYLAKDATEKADLTVETKYSVRAHKLTTKNLKDLCDLFYIDRSVQDGVPVGKDELVERLLNFLSAPDEKLVKKKKILKRKKKKGFPGKKKKKKKKKKS